MKKLLTILLTATLLLLPISCTNTNTPEAVTEKFVTSLANADYKQAKKYITETSSDFIDWCELIADKDEEGNPKKEEFKYKHINTEISEDGQHARVTFKNEAKPEEHEDTVDLSKKDGKWLVDFDNYE